ncbi:AfsR/SARP family transcriptional regulator [Streptomyces cinerochromogenes]|uniref:AfsR/SARP family transcriptional regulator n=1 Tax=Streptomyces cinerochromogenes TaxID=66422 RepID=UPI0033BB089E
MEVELLGPVGFRVGGRRMEIGSDKERILLASLALEAGRPLALETLIDRLWDGDPPPHGRANTHTYVSRIRRRLRSGAGAPDGTRIACRAHTYTLEITWESVDWHVFRRLVSQAGAAAAEGDDQRAVVLLDRAERLWRGDALAGLPGPWAQSMRGVMAERRLAASVSRTAALLRLGRFAETTGELAALVGLHPGDETLAGQLMLAYYGTHRYADALRVHQEVRRSLLAQYGSRPGAELNRIHRGILERLPALDIVHGRRASAPPTATVSPPATGAPRNLPRQPLLIGRREQLRLLTTAVDSVPGQGAVVSLETVSTVSGMAGVGKTALAVHGAHLLARSFPDGQLYLNLRGHDPGQEPLCPAEALALLLRLLGTPTETIPAELESRTALWRTLLAERRAVIVLDDAADADQVRPLLPGHSPSLTIITSRRHLTGLTQVRHIPLDVLPTDDAIALFRAFAGADRARDVQEITRIVRLCGHLPLAIELVASRFRMRPSWTLGTLTDRLLRADSRLSELRDADQDMVRVAFDLTYQALSEEQRTAFRRLSLHPGPDFTAEVAAAALDLPTARTERVLESLLACHVLREPVPERYHYHDLLREYGMSRALTDDSEEDRAGVVRRLTEFHLAAADHADRLAYPRRRRAAPARSVPWQLAPLGDARAARAWLSLERQNLLAVERHCRTHGRAEDAAQLAYVIAEFLNTECHWQDALTILEPAAAHWSRTGNDSALCRALDHLSAAHAHTGHYPEAARIGERARDIARLTGDTEAEAEILRTLGTLKWHVGDHYAALSLLQRSFAIRKTTGDAWDHARAHNNMAVTLLFLGEYRRALEHFEKAVSGFTETGDHTALGKTLNNMGDLYIRTGELESARRSFEEALRFLDSSGNRYDRATVKGGLADVLTSCGDSVQALRLYEEALTEFRALRDPKSEADMLIGLGEALRRAGDTEKALRHLRAALDNARALGAAHQEARATRCLGETYAGLGRREDAVALLRTAVELSGRTHDASELAAAEDALRRARSNTIETCKTNEQ